MSLPSVSVSPMRRVRGWECRRHRQRTLRQQAHGPARKRLRRLEGRWPCRCARASPSCRAAACLNKRAGIAVAVGSMFAWIEHETRHARLVCRHHAAVGGLCARSRRNRRHRVDPDRVQRAAEYGATTWPSRNASSENGLSPSAASSTSSRNAERSGSGQQGRRPDCPGPETGVRWRSCARIVRSFSA